MNYDELAFANQQLAGMLQSGIPLEGALKQLCANMRRGAGRAEFERLEADLSQGVPLEEALGKRRLPEFYVAMLRVGIKSNNLPAVLNLLADHYHTAHTTWTRLKGLMVYPAIVFVMALLLSAGLAVVLSRIGADSNAFARELAAGGFYQPAMVPPLFLMWLPVGFIALGVVGLFTLLWVPACRQWLNWHVPAFREANLSQFAASLALLLSEGCQLREALDLLQRMESDRPLGRELAGWQRRLAAGQTRFADLAVGARIIPPLFIWLVASAGEDWAAGLRQAAEIFQRRAMHRIELALYAAMPVSILLLGALIVAEVMPVVLTMRSVMVMLTSF